MMMWEMSKFRLSQCFLPVPLSEVCNKKKHHRSSTLIGLHSPFPLLQYIQDYSGPLLTCCLMFPLFLWVASIQSPWKYTLLWEREARTWHPDTLMSPWSGYDIIKALSNEKMQYYTQATEQYCLSSRGHGSLVASGKRSTCYHKVTEK